MHIIPSPLFDFEAFISQKENNRLVRVLEYCQPKVIDRIGIGAQDRTQRLFRAGMRQPLSESIAG